MSKKSTILFFSVVIILFVIMTYQSRKGHMLAGSFMSGMLNTSHSFIQSLSDTIKEPFRKIAIRDEENRRLKKQIDELRLQLASQQEAVIENKRLRELLKLKEREKKYVLTARIIAKGVDHWTNTRLIDKGSRDGIAKDMVAITPKGLAGKVLNVSDSYANLLLITDINFSAAVRIQESRKEGVISGTGTGKLILKYIPYEENISEGDIVITSGLDLLFQPGIPVGYISKIDRKSTGHFQDIEVSPYVDTSRLEEVVIVR